MMSLSIEGVLTGILEILLFVFTYVIPLFSTIRAVHTQEEASFQQWLTYWLLINVINPFFRFFRFHPLIHLMTVLYLSLPKFQGALHIYHELIGFDEVMERYGVEDKVDVKIKHVKKSLKKALWNVAKDIGWGTMCQIGEIVSLFQNTDDSKESSGGEESIEEDEHIAEGNDKEHTGSAISLVSERIEEDASLDKGGEEDSCFSEEEDGDAASVKVEDIEDGDISEDEEYKEDMPEDMEETEEEGQIDKDTGLSPVEGHEENTVNDIEKDGGVGVKNSTSLMVEDDDVIDDTNNELETREQCSHFVAESRDSNSPEYFSRDEKEYLKDFLIMLEKGLYVFAYFPEKKRMEVGSNSNEARKANESKLFRLRNFLFQPAGTDGEKRSGGYFILRTVESSSDEETFKLPLSSIDEVRRTGISGIQFLSIKKPEISPSNSISDHISCDNSLATSPSMVTITSFLTNRVDKDVIDDDDEVLLLEISLSDESECSTLIKGFQLSVAKITSNSGNTEDKRDGNSDNDKVLQMKGESKSPTMSTETEPEENPDKLNRPDLHSNPFHTDGNDIDRKTDDKAVSNIQHGESSDMIIESKSLEGECCDVVDWSMSSPNKNKKNLDCEAKDCNRGTHLDLEYTALNDGE